MNTKYKSSSLTDDKNEIFSFTRDDLERIGFPRGDIVQSSQLHFDDGANFRIEVPTVNSLSAAEHLLESAEKRVINQNR